MLHILLDVALPVKNDWTVRKWMGKTTVNVLYQAPTVLPADQMDSVCVSVSTQTFKYPSLSSFASSNSFHKNLIFNRICPSHN